MGEHSVVAQYRKGWNCMKKYSQIMSNKEKVEEQYKDGSNLSDRISIHEKYSSNKQGLANWLFSQYNFPLGGKVLELGSGTGDLWRNKFEGISEGIEVYLSDFSEGMVSELTRKYKSFSFVSSQKIDVQEIPFEDNFFDIIIANFMLYHVPDIGKALEEVFRVLKPNGVFYVATVGDNHLIEINQWVKEFDDNLDVFNSASLAFTLQNGSDILEKYFSKVSMYEYFDHLEVDNKQELIKYISTFKDMTDLSHATIDGLSTFLDKKKSSEGLFHITKQSGTFVCQKVI